MTPGIATSVDWPALLNEITGTCAPLRDGRVAQYIPALADVDPEQFAVAVCTIDGEVTVVGDEAATFTLQSICKPFLYGTALAHLGSGTVRTQVGVEPTGEPFDSFVRLERGRHRPHNPMVNAGAITMAGLLLDAFEPDDRDAPQLFAPYAGTVLTVDEKTYTSEAQTADRNRAIAHLLEYFDRLPADVEDALAFYFRCCSVLVHPYDLAIMGGVLAAGGQHPMTAERVLPRACVRDVLRVMTTCGMYDASGRFAFEVGMPAKSGVSGGVLGIVPGEFAIGVFSPRLDGHGNSVRGLAALRQIGQHMRSHMFMRHRRKRRLPSIETLRETVSAVVGQSLREHRGRLADYCPLLAEQNPDLTAFALCDVNGGEVAVGSTAQSFSLQACANPFTYALALERHGVDQVHARVGFEPSGNPFDAIPFSPVSRLPQNPLGNAGAITVASLLSCDPKEMADVLSGFAGPEVLAADSAILACEREAGGRNRAIAYQLKNFGVLETVDPAMDRYFHQCAIRITVRQAARMAATLAAGGVNPLTRTRVVTESVVRPVLTMMFMCGLHDYSGRFAFEVGLPAKSGIAGGIVAVVPGRMGLAVFSPRIDRYGASVRGVRMLRAFSRRLGLGLFTAATD